MKIILLALAALSFLGLITYSVQKNAVSNEPQKIAVDETAKIFPAKGKTPVLVELFTSEGCSSCPPADRVLSELDKDQPTAGAEIITLSLHVDYWNNLGWKDRFSSPLYSQRQTIYGQKFKLDSIYTPQMIVDGEKQFVGSSLDEASKAVGESAKTPKAKIELVRDEDKLKVIVSDIPAHEDASVFLAIAEDDLSTKVGGGENGGRTLQHTSVARDLKPLGRILPADNNFQTETMLQFQPDWKKENLKLIVFLQENQSRKILGVNKILLDKK
ncbi:MAG: DUF1223 domain-containing protein [Pyrinomonadaceae bacterium]